jgi:hypothetical protein
MNRHLVRLLLMLYPRSWRDRYGPEVVRLTQELIAVGETTPARGALNMAGAALAERLRVLAGSTRTAVAMAVAALLAVAGSFYASGHTRPQKPPSAVSAVARPLAPAKLTSCVIWRDPAGSVAVQAPVKVNPVKVTLVIGANPGQVIKVLTPVGVTVPVHSAPQNATVQLKTGRVWCVIPVPGPVSSGP